MDFKLKNWKLGNSVVNSIVWYESAYFIKLIIMEHSKFWQKVGHESALNKCGSHRVSLLIEINWKNMCVIFYPFYLDSFLDEQVPVYF